MTIQNRRSFLKLGAVSLAGLSCSQGVFCLASENETFPTSKDWKLGCQAWSFNRFTFFDAIDKTASAGLKYIEGYPNQKISKKNNNPVNSDLSSEDKKIILQKLKDADVHWINFGVVGIPTKKEEATKLFAFAEEMGIETLVSEPSEKQFDLLDELTEKYKINVAIHNHPKPSHYWDVDTVLKALKNHSKRIGSCADTGHWVRSGLDPLECLQKLEGRIISLHFKDLNEKSPKAHDVPWGTGISNAKGMLDELKKQKFRGVFSLEYEHNWENNLPDIKKCAQFFNDYLKKSST